MVKYLLKEVVDLRWRDQDFASIAAISCEEFNKGSFQNPPPLTAKMADFTTHDCFVS